MTIRTLIVLLAVLIVFIVSLALFSERLVSISGVQWSAFCPQAISGVRTPEGCTRKMVRYLIALTSRPS